MYSSKLPAEQFRLTQKADAQTIRAVAWVSSRLLSLLSRLERLAPCRVCRLFSSQASLTRSSR